MHSLYSKIGLDESHMKVAGVVVCIDGFLFMVHTIIYRLHVHIIQNFLFVYLV
jgi:hypothetical protein